jgi:tetratricopeptide (TPR) repeat protein
MVFAQGGGGGTSGGGGTGGGSGGGSGSGSGSGGSGGSGATGNSASNGGSGVSGASGAGPGAPGPSGTSASDGLSPDISATGATGAIADFWAPRRLLQTAEKAAADAAHYAALAAKAAERADGGQAGRGQPGGLADDLAGAARDAARVAADSAREAARAATEVARSPIASGADANAAVRRLTIQAGDASERAREAFEEASDRPAHLAAASPPAALATTSENPFQRFRRSMQAQASFVRGRALLEARKYQEAREQLAEATALAPDHDEARALLGWSQYFVGESREAIITFKSALRRQPTWEGLYNGLGWSRLRLSRYHLAIAAFREAIDRNTDYVDAINGLGSALFELGQYDAALPLLEKALRGTRRLVGHDPPETTPLRHKVAWTLYYVGRYREALALFIRGNLAAPNSPQFLVGMGWCYMQLGQRGDARAAFQRALQLGPTDEAAREGFRRAGS